jgi:hypothetical protein
VNKHAGKNINFYVVATTYATEFLKLIKGERITRAKHIFLTFCAECADQQINLSYNLVLKLDNSIIHMYSKKVRKTA